MPPSLSALTTRGLTSHDTHESSELVRLREQADTLDEVRASKADMAIFLAHQLKENTRLQDALTKARGSLEAASRRFEEDLRALDPTDFRSTSWVCMCASDAMFTFWGRRVCWCSDAAGGRGAVVTRATGGARRRPGAPRRAPRGP